MKKKILSALLIACLGSALLVGCGQTKPAGPPAPAPAPAAEPAAAPAEKTHLCHGTG
jgi:hypothetical protein